MDEIISITPIVEYNKMRSDSRSGVMKADDDMLAAYAKEKPFSTLVALKGSISMDWLKRESLAGEDRYIWSANMPLPFFKCALVYKSAASMPKDIVMDLAFPDYDLNEYEEILFDVCYKYGSAIGLQVVCEKIFEFAKEGDMRAAKLLLEYKKEIQADGLGAGNSLSVLFDMGSN